MSYGLRGKVIWVNFTNGAIGPPSPPQRYVCGVCLVLTNILRHEQ